MSNYFDEYESENPFGLETDSDFHLSRRNTTISLIKKYAENFVDVKILDAGCGTGIITGLINKNFPNARIDAIDISEKAIEIALKKYMAVKFFKDDALTFKGFGYLYDVIVLNNIYEHIENPAGLLVNLKKLLTDEGVFIISTPNRYHAKNVIRKIFGLKIVIPKYHITEYSIGQIYDHHFYAGLMVKKLVFPKFKRERFRIMDFLIFKVIQPVFDFWFILTKSRTRLGSLMFIISGI